MNRTGISVIAFVHSFADDIRASMMRHQHRPWYGARSMLATCPVGLLRVPVHVVDSDLAFVNVCTCCAASAMFFAPESHQPGLELA